MKQLAILAILLAGTILLAMPTWAQSQCYAGVREQTPQCVGAQLMTDEYSNGCREFVCEGESSTMTVVACDKPDEGDKDHFEMYKVFQAGSGIDFCLSGTCLGAKGFAQSQACTDDIGGNGTGNGTAPNTTGASAALNIDPLFPQGPNYVFSCDASGFVPTTYEWTFGDGTTATEPGTRQEPYLGLPNATVINKDIFHTFAANGSYTVTCTASDGRKSATAQRTVTVQTPIAVNQSNPFAVLLQAQPAQAGLLEYNLACSAVGFPADVAWRISAENGTTIYDYGPYGSPDQRNITIRFPASGAYVVSCSVRTYVNQYNPAYYEPNYVPSSSSFGVISLDKTITLPVGTGANITPGSCAISAQTPRCIDGQLVSNQRSGGCWEFTCVNGTAGTIVKACEKPGSYDPQHIELYRVSSTGQRLNFCLGTTCLNNSDFARSGTTCEAPNTTNQTNSSVSLRIAPYYPKGEEYVFFCDAGFGATSYDFDFGDDSRITGMIFDNSFHKYTQNGTYNVTCTARNNATIGSGTIVVNIGNATTGNKTCYSTVKDIPAACAGNITQDESSNGCRRITCAAADGSTAVLVCDKPSATNPEKFEMYKQSQTGAGPRICLGPTCISDNGFASNTYPHCS